MIVLIWGTRPEAIKLGPIAAELSALRAPWSAICTGQHTSLLAGTPAETDLGRSASLGLASTGDVIRWLRKAERLLQGRLEAIPGVVVVVQGDTMSALAGARACAAVGGTLCHVEAGVRSHAKEPFPEEAFRVEIDGMADHFYAPTTTTFANLVTEGRPMLKIRVTGNSVVSALQRYTAAVPTLPSDHALITLHRREWISGPNFVGVLDALAAAASDHAAARFFWPIHPNVEQRLSQRWLAGLPANLMLSKPLPYREAAGVLAHAFGVLTDSGGLVEEAATLGVPSVQLRNVSDRPEAIDAGVSLRFDATPDGVYAGMQALTTGRLPRRPVDVFGHSDAASQIARHLASLTLEEYVSV